jgi:hypothetical protein
VVEHKSFFRGIVLFLLLLLSGSFLCSCGSGSGGAVASPSTTEETRAQDTRTFTINAASLPFAALSGSAVDADRWSGVLGNSAYHIEVPKTTWNGMLVMYAHGYVGPITTLNATSMPNGLRHYLLDNGYAWAAAGYSKNYYDVRAGLEDTNALALNFNSIAAANGRLLAAPIKIYIVGQSMGGHIAAAAVEDESYATAVNKVHYNGAVPLCGAVGDTELFNYIGAAQLAAQKLAGYDGIVDWSSVKTNVQNALFTSFPVVPLYQSAVVTTASGNTFKGVMMNLTGGSRPMFDQGFAGSTALGVTGVSYLGVIWDTFGSDGTINGILNKNIIDTNAVVYQFDADPVLTPAESVFNASILRFTAVTNANRLRSDGLRWVPAVNGQFSVPVVTLHTLGDIYVPFRMEQVYYNRAQVSTGKNWLVQRAIRGISHCDFTVAEQVKALDDMLNWEQHGIKPAGDDVVTAATVAASNYGCNFTNNTTGSDDVATTVAIRPLLPACP